MAKVQKTYTQEFKREAVRLAQSSGKSIAQVTRELGISDTRVAKRTTYVTELHHAGRDRPIIRRGIPESESHSYC